MLDKKENKMEQLEETYYDYFESVSRDLTFTLVKAYNRACVGEKAKMNLESLDKLNRKNGFTIHMYSNESGHNTPHFHLIISKAVNLSISIETCEIIQGSVSGKDKKLVKEICQIIAGDQESKELLSKMWNESNSYVKIENLN